MEVRFSTQELIPAMIGVGLARVCRFGFEQGLIPKEFESSVGFSGYAVSFPCELLSYLPKVYLHYIAREYDSVDFLKNQVAAIEQVEDFKEALKKLNKTVVRYAEIIGLKKKGKKQELDIKEDEFSDAVEKIKSFLEEGDSGEKIGLANAKFMLQDNFGQVSFLNSSVKELPTVENYARYLQEYVAKALKEIKLQEKINSLSTLDRKQTEALVAEFYAFGKGKNTAKSVPKEAKDDPVRFIETHFIPCPIVDGLFATVPYEEKRFAPFAQSVEGGINFGWNNMPSIYISHTASFLLWFAPLGCARRFDSETETHVYSFIMSYQPIKRLIAVNDMFKAIKDGQVFTALSNVLESAEAKAEATLNNSLFIEYNTKIAPNTKKVLSKVLCFNIRDYMAKFFAVNSYAKDELKRLAMSDNKYHQIAVEEIAKAVFSDCPILPLLKKEVKTAISDRRFCLIKPYALSLLKIKELKGGKSMEEYYSFFYKEGSQLADSLGWPSEKITGFVQDCFTKIHYENRKLFFEQVMKLYTQAKIPFPQKFLKIFEEDSELFGVIACSFIAGLYNQAKSGYALDKAKNDNEKEENDEDGTQICSL